jgi:hypothetical protein
MAVTTESPRLPVFQFHPAHRKPHTDVNDDRHRRGRHIRHLLPRQFRRCANERDVDDDVGQRRSTFALGRTDTSLRGRLTQLSCKAPRLLSG